MIHFRAFGFILCCMMFSATAEPLSPESYLLKISQRLTGTWPTSRDYAKLAEEMETTNCRETSCLKDFFQSYIQDEMQSSAFYSEAVLKVFEKFGFQAPAYLPFPIYRRGNIYSTSERFGSEILLVYRVFHQNLSIDELFTSQIQWSRMDLIEAFDDLYDPPFKIQPVAAPVKGTPVDVKGYPQIQTEISESDYTSHPNVSGMFSTDRFLKRYWNTPINGNRKRAAAVLKIMLCDALSPALERDSQRVQEERLARGIPPTARVGSNNRSFEEIHKNRHAHQNDCALCHTRLDPIARTMIPMELGVSNIPVSGNLRFYSGINELKDTKVRSFHELVTTATRQPRYVDCQLNWMFNWIVGKDVSLHPVRYQEIQEQFERSGRKIKDLIVTLLLSPEFRGVPPEYAQAQTFARADGVLQNCYFCHSSFTRTHGEQLKLNLSKIAFKLDLAHGGAKRAMPPTTHWWHPDSQDLGAIKTWFEQGAPLVESYPVFSEDEVTKILQGGPK